MIFVAMRSEKQHPIFVFVRGYIYTIIKKGRERERAGEGEGEGEGEREVSS